MDNLCSVYQFVVVRDGIDDTLLGNNIVKLRSDR